MKSLTAVMAEHPTLNAAGHAASKVSPYFDMERERRELAESGHKIKVAMEYLASLPVVKVTSRRARDSYELKHKAERTELALKTASGYISNGSLIAAAYMLGLEVRPAGINATIGVGWGPGEQ